MAKKSRFLGKPNDQSKTPKSPTKPDNWEALTGQDRINILSNLFPQVKDFLGK